VSNKKETIDAKQLYQNFKKIQILL